MNCDQVFDILTRAAFPTGETTDDAVEAHLTACHDCRQLAEALRPAVSLFHECLPQEGGEGGTQVLPTYRGRLNAAASDLPTQVSRLPVTPDHWSEQAAVAPVPRGREPRRRSLGLPAQLLATALCSLTVCALFWMLFTQGPSKVDPGAAQLAPSLINLADFAPLDERGLQRLAELGLPENCLQIKTSGIRLMCCTECHSAARDDRPEVQRGVVMWTACRECHAKQGKMAAHSWPPSSPTPPLAFAFAG